MARAGRSVARRPGVTRRAYARRIRSHRRSARRGASLLLACVLCAAGAAAALAAPGHGSRHRLTHAARACHHHARRCHCRTSHIAARTHHKHKQCLHRKPTVRTHPSAAGRSGPASGSATPGATGAAPGSAPGSGTTAPGSAGGGSTESPSGPAAPARVQVLAKEYSLTLSRTEVPAGRVTVEFVNGGQDEHNLHSIEPIEGTEAGTFPDTVPGVHTDLTFTMRAGSYTLLCSLPHHEEKGMRATLVVR